LWTLNRLSSSSIIASPRDFRSEILVGEGRERDCIINDAIMATFVDATSGEVSGVLL
jgi:hypothetical protein